MTDTTILPNVPAYVQHTDHNEYGYNRYDHGISTKDRLHLSSDALNDALRDTVKDIGLVGVAVEKNGAANQLATEKIGAANQLVTEKVGAAHHNASAASFSNTQNMIVSGFKDGRYDAAVNTASIQERAAINACDIRSQLAECCCELKEVVRNEGDKTRTLISTLDNQRLAGELSDAKNEITLLKLQEARS